MAALRTQLLLGNVGPAPASLLHCRLSVKPANPPADDPSCLTCYRAPSANALALVKFIKYAVQQPDVWFVTYSDLVGAFAVFARLGTAAAVPRCSSKRCQASCVQLARRHAG